MAAIRASGAGVRLLRDGLITAVMRQGTGIPPSNNEVMEVHMYSYNLASLLIPGSG